MSALRDCLGAGEPLNPEVIEQVRSAWGSTVRDGYGQTETTAHTPGQAVRLGSMGRPLPGYEVTLIDPLTEFADLPKTISGKIRRVELRGQENERAGKGTAAARDPDGIGGPFRREPSPRGTTEFWEEDFSW